ncbi:MAG TPA: TonB-dependent receptor [Pelobium sp.]|nr:TonB-dependent receptor [Pelobium sp.]
MQINPFLLTGIFCLLFLATFSQSKTSKISGKITDEDGFPVPGALVKIQNNTVSAVSDVDGIFKLEKLAAGNYVLSISSVGMSPQRKTVSVKVGNAVNINIKLANDVQQLQTVNVIGRTEVQEVNRQAYNVTAIDAKKFHNSSQDINQVLGKTAGVRIREDGGLGSNFNFSLNGFSGNQVKFFIDGIPMDNFGSSLSLNNIPINLADRIEVYKGVVPIWLGSDALGGAINIVTNSSIKNYLDLSYSYGSFNTHRTAVSTGYTNKKTGLSFNANIFANQSDNSYWVTTGVKDLDSKIISAPQRVRRFHDGYNSESIQTEVGVVNKKYADKLMFGVVLAQNHREIQTGAQMSLVFGGWNQKSSTVMPTVKYQKNDLFTKGLSVKLYGSYNFGSTQNIDTLNREYNWLGEYKDNSVNSSGQPVAGGENSRSLYKFQNNSAIANSNISYTISPNHSIGLNYVFSNFDRTGSDVLKPNEEAYKQPQILRKHNLGFGYKYDYEDRLSVSVFAKQYFQQGESAQRVDIYVNPHWESVNNNLSANGYGMASTYFVSKNLQLKTSYEKTYRLPEGTEMFGDGINQIANKTLKPESSHNINLGFAYNKSLNQKHHLNMEANFLYRDASDFIRVDLLDNRTQSVNVRGVNNTGFDAQVKYNYANWLSAGFNVTYQYLINTTKYESANSNVVSIVYKDQIPNIPYLYGNANVGVRFLKLKPTNGSLRLNYHLNYVHAYYLKWPSLGSSSSKNEIPQQLSHDIEAGYSIKKGKYNISAECRNLTDQQLYDNFLMQKPGRSFFLKLRYFIH